MEVSTKEKVSLVRAGILPDSWKYSAAFRASIFCTDSPNPVPKIAKAAQLGDSVKSKIAAMQTASQQNRPDISYQNLSNSIWGQLACILHIHTSPGKNPTLKKQLQNFIFTKVYITKSKEFVERPFLPVKG